MAQYSILINTCDKFEDCWHPFFKLFSIYWSDYDGKIYLNTEYKDFSYPELNIIPVKGCEKHQFPKTKRATWSQCLKWALESMDTDIVLYLQEDYFLKDYVKNDIIEKYAGLMRSNDNIHCIHLTDTSEVTKQFSKEHDDLCPVDPKCNGRINCQAALWQKNFLLSCIRIYESAWQFEALGSQREMAKLHNIYGIESVRLNKFEIIPYIFTGVVQGRWYEEVVPLFEKHNIDIDYTLRGFLNDAPKRTISMKVRDKFIRTYYQVRNYFEIRKLKK